MLTLRQEQYDSLRQTALDAFVAKMVHHLGERFPEECERLGEASLRSLIRGGIERGAEHGISDENDVCRWLEYLVRFGPDFGCDSRSWARPFLLDNGMDGTRKMNALDDYYLFVLTLEK
jgi:hypothetical protein